MPLLLRSVCTFGRAVDTVYIVRTAAVSAACAKQLETELLRRSNRPTVIWLEPGGALPMAAGLFVIWLPGVFDSKLCRTLLTVPQTDRKVIRCSRPGEETPVLWYVGRDRCAEVARCLAQPGSSVGDLLMGAVTDEYDPRDYLCAPVLDEPSRLAAEQHLFAGTRKPTDTWIARHFDRNISNWITRRLLPFSITPNQVTLISFGLGVLGALLFLLGTHTAAVAGGILLVLSIIVDGCDGEIARLKFMEGPWGRKLDFALDNVVNAMALFTIGAGYYLQSGERFFLYAPMFNASFALLSAFPVYFLFYQKDADPTEALGPKTIATRMTEAVAGRDFMYAILFLALFHRAHWFVYLTLGGIVFFFLSVLVMLLRQRFGSDTRGVAHRIVQVGHAVAEPGEAMYRETGTRSRRGE